MTEQQTIANLMNKTDYIKTIFTSFSYRQFIDGVHWFARLMVNLNVKQKRRTEPSDHLDWELEKDDITERAEWLYNMIMVEPEELQRKMPAILGKHYGGEWTIYSVFMLITALANMSDIYPELKAWAMERMERLISLMLEPEMRLYDTESWGEDAFLGLNGTKDHMTFLSLMAVAIGHYINCGGKNDKFNDIFCRCCEVLNRRMLAKKDLNLRSFPRTPIFIADMGAAVVALQMHSNLYGGCFDATVNKWIELAKRNLTHKKTGLLIAIKWYGRKAGIRNVRGSYTGLTNYWLSMLNDKDFARSQYQLMIRHLRKDTPVAGIKEYLYRAPKFKLDPDAGPIIYGISGSGTTFALGCVTYFKDYKFRNRILQTAEIAGITKKDKKGRHYLLGKLALVGEATALAMRTHHSYGII